MTDTIRINIPSKPRNLKWVYSVSQALLNELPIDERTAHFLLVAISEGFTNAVIHGNGMEPDKWVRMLYHIGEDFIRVEIQDEGVVTVFKDVDDLADVAEPDQVSGRGLALIKNLVDEVSFEYNEGGGNRLIITRYFERRERTEVFN